MDLVLLAQDGVPGQKEADVYMVSYKSGKRENDQGQIGYLLAVNRLVKSVPVTAQIMRQLCIVIILKYP